MLRNYLRTIPMFLLLHGIAAHAEEPKLVTLFVSDLHGQLRGKPEKNVGGYARLKTLIDTERSAASGPTDVLVISGGDAFGKSAEPCRASGEKECAPLLKDVGVDVAVFGNGELKRPRAELLDLLKLSGIPWVSTNVKAAGATWTDSYVYKGAKSGMEVVIFSFTVPPSPGELEPKKAGYTVTRGLPSAAEWARLEKIAGTRPVIWVGHQYVEDDKALAEEACRHKFKSIAFLKGHTHRARAEEAGLCMPFVEPGAFGETVSRLEWKKVEGQFTAVPHRFVALDAQIAENGDVKSKVNDLYRKLAPTADTRVAEVKAGRDEKGVATWLAEMYKKVSSADIAFVNQGAVKDGLEAGPLSHERLVTVIPYNNDLVGADVAVSELEKALCSAEARPRDLYEDEGSQIVMAGARVVNAGTPQCKLETSRRGRVKVVLDSYLLSRSPRWLGMSLNGKSFKFGMNTERALIRGLQLTGGSL